MQINFLFVLPPTACHWHFNLFLVIVGSFPELMNEKLLHFYKVVEKLQNQFIKFKIRTQKSNFYAFVSDHQKLKSCRSNII